MYVNTAKIPLVSLRSAVIADDVALSAFAYDDWPSSNTLNNVRGHPNMLDASGVAFMFWGTNAENEDFAYKLYCRLRCNGPIMLAAEGIVTLGSQVAATDPVDKTTAITLGFWADSVTVTGGILKDLTDILDFGGNRICMLKMDGVFFNDWYLEIDLDGGSSTAAAAYGAITGY